MRHKGDIAQFRQIRVIRDLQRIAAEGDAGRAALASREKDAALNGSKRHRESAEAGWSAALSAPPVEVGAVALWSQALRERDGAVRAATAEAGKARADLDGRTAELRAAIRRRELAHDLVKRTEKRRAADRDEAELQRATDLFLLRGFAT